MAAIITKGEIVLFALRKSAIASDATLTDAEPQSVQDALSDLEDMMHEWMIVPGNIGYIFAADDALPLPDDDSGLLPIYKSGVGYQLLLRLLSDYGMEPTPRQETNAAKAYDAILTATLKVPSILRRGDMPTGQGNKYDYFMMGRYYPDERGSVDADDTTPSS